MSLFNIRLWFNCLQKSLIPSLEEEPGPLLRDFTIFQPCIDFSNIHIDFRLIRNLNVDFHIELW